MIYVTVLPQDSGVKITLTSVANTMDIIGSYLVIARGSMLVEISLLLYVFISDSDVLRVCTRAPLVYFEGHYAVDCMGDIYSFRDIDSFEALYDAVKGAFSVQKIG